MMKERYFKLAIGTAIPSIINVIEKRRHIINIEPSADCSSGSHRATYPSFCLIVPDMTTLVTLEVHSPGGNDSVSLVPVRNWKIKEYKQKHLEKTFFFFFYFSPNVFTQLQHMFVLCSVYSTINYKIQNKIAEIVVKSMRHPATLSIA